MLLTRSVWFLFKFGYAIEAVDDVEEGHFEDEFEPLMDDSDFPEFPIENTELVLNAPSAFCPCNGAWGDLELDVGVFFCELDSSVEELEF